MRYHEATLPPSPFAELYIKGKLAALPWAHQLRELKRVILYRQVLKNTETLVSSYAMLFIH